MKKKTIFAVVVSIMLVIAFAGCGGATLESYLNDNPSEQEALDQTLDELNDLGIMTAEADVSGNTLTITGTMTETFPADTVKYLGDALEEQSDTLAEEYDSLKKDAEEQAGVKAEDITIIIVFNNGDGSEIWSKEF